MGRSPRQAAMVLREQVPRHPAGQEAAHAQVILNIAYVPFMVIFSAYISVMRILSEFLRQIRSARNRIHNYCLYQF